jgi:uncharacterized protein (DUF1810 family)
MAMFDLASFDSAAPAEGLFRAALTKFCNGAADPRTLELLARRQKSV